MQSFSERYINDAARLRRYLCLRAVGHILAALMNDREIYDPSAAAGSGNHRQEHAAACTKVMIVALRFAWGAVLDLRINTHSAFPGDS